MNARFAVLLFALSAPAHAADPMHLLIFSGGKTEADAKRALESLEKLKPILSRAVTLSPGQPRIVESSQLPGLTAGFWIVTLGLCRTPAAALAAIKAIYPGAYSKPLTGEVKEACPVLEDKVVALEAATKIAGKSLNTFSLREEEQDDRGADVSTTTLHFVLVDKASGQVLDLAQAPGGGTGAAGSEGPGGREYETCTPRVTAEKTGLKVVRTCTSERTGCNLKEKAIPKEWTETEKVTVSNDKLAVSPSKTSVTTRTDCVAGADYGD